MWKGEPLVLHFVKTEILHHTDLSAVLWQNDSIYFNWSLKRKISEYKVENNPEIVHKTFPNWCLLLVMLAGGGGFRLEKAANSRKKKCFFSTGNLLHTFEPLFPERLWLDERTFCHAFPFHLVFDETVRKLWDGFFGLNLSARGWGWCGHA